MSLTYSEYLRLDSLLAIQNPKSDPAEHDETLFIIIHQAYELWFKQMLHEFDLLTTRLRTGDTFKSVRTLRRILVILKLAVAQTDVIETMTPTSFNRFRDQLEQASGFQSFQFREVEFFCGHKNRKHLKLFPEGNPFRPRLERRLAEPALYDYFLDYLEARGYELPEGARREDVSKTIEENPVLQDAICEIYLRDPEMALLTEMFVDFDEGFQEFRYRHVKMVERTIGDKTGTGGSSGVGYLRSTLFQPFFPDLWRFRGQL